MSLFDEFQALLVEARDLGIHYSGTDPEELKGYLDIYRKEKQKGRPLCFGLSFDGNDRRCRVCQLNQRCMKLAPEVEGTSSGEVRPLPCSFCNVGELSTELLNPETKQIDDYGCTSESCQNTIGKQHGWSIPVQEIDISFKPPAVEQKETADKRQILYGKKYRIKKKKEAVRKTSQAQDKSGLRFCYKGEIYFSLSSISRLVTGRKTQSGYHWFGVKKEDIRAGIELTRKFKGDSYKVKVMSPSGE